MVNTIRLIVLTLIILSCEKSNDNDNPFIPDVRFEKILNINLPSYNDLKYNGGSYYINGLGVKGVILFNLNDNIIAWEASCPNEKPSDCSRMEIKGLQGECKCNSNLYSLANGQPLKINTNNSFPMVPYYTEKSGNSLRIYN
jgi:nitrite reductase/ring-hydroxylating ferredoxin subunit